jgi:hypothetical protein
MRGFGFLGAMLLQAFAVAACAVPVHSSNCESIVIDSAGARNFVNERVSGAAKSHGLGGIADYVIIKLPALDNYVYPAALTELIVLAESKPMVEPKCAKLVDPEKSFFNCVQSIPGTGLELLAKFRDGSESAKYAESMPSLLAYVRQDVLCKSSDSSTPGENAWPALAPS